MPTGGEVPPSPHEVLGLPASATAAEITAAYRRLARRHHPDVSGEADDGARFAEAAAAYAALGQGRPTTAAEPAPRPSRRAATSVPVRHVAPAAPPEPAPDPARLLRAVRTSWRPLSELRPGSRPEPL